MSEEAFIARNTGLIIPEERSNRMKDLKFEIAEVPAQKRRLGFIQNIEEDIEEFFEGKEE